MVCLIENSGDDEPWSLLNMLKIQDLCEHKFCGNPHSNSIWLELIYGIRIFLCDSCLDRISALCNIAREVRTSILMMEVPLPITQWGIEVLHEIHESGITLQPYLYYLMRYLFEILDQIDTAITWTWDGTRELLKALDALEENLTLIRPVGAVSLIR